jgi:hypothetical protein
MSKGQDIQSTSGEHASVFSEDVAKPTSVLRRTVLRCTYTEVDKGGRVALNTIHAESAAMGNDLFIGTAHDGSAGTCKIGQSKISKVISIYLEC